VYFQKADKKLGTKRRLRNHLKKKTGRLAFVNFRAFLDLGRKGKGINFHFNKNKGRPKKTYKEVSTEWRFAHDGKSKTKTQRSLPLMFGLTFSSPKKEKSPVFFLFLLSKGGGGDAR